ncbi:MAG: cob(I)yrinic acid a,c-diamide adenosyltransferase [Chitinispirillales bacterium]|jgi:cob(I)alamin adenosyltransferase|nr:cob(I)yrinic acid a,c-diamide adenosyltransferase [Chitinispirillales bacterium]
MKANNSDNPEKADKAAVFKNGALIHLIGTMDELNAHIGLIKAKITGKNEYKGENGKEFIESIQKNLMKIMAHSSDIANERYFLTQAEITELERKINNLQKYLPNQFVLPGETEIEAYIHIARTVARRAERQFVAAATEKPLCFYAGTYLNRLSDYLFALACMSA